jgi:hypothetical protein
MAVASELVALRKPAPIGSMRWAEARHGSLTKREVFALARQAILAQMNDLPSQVRAWLGRGRSGGSALFSHRDPPGSQLTRDARELSREASPAPLFGHCVRCWYWGDLFAQVDSIAYEPELLYVSCLLHDLALTDGFRPSPVGECRCFALRGGEVAREFLLERGAETEFAERVADTISLHMNVQVPKHLGGEAHLLHAAAHLDVAGTRAGDLSAGEIQAVLDAEPREGFAVQFGQYMRREASERPRSRAALLWRLGMKLPLSHNPLDHAR